MELLKSERLIDDRSEREAENMTVVGIIFETDIFYFLFVGCERFVFFGDEVVLCRKVLPMANV
jgi:hypothetical protein